MRFHHLLCAFLMLLFTAAAALPQDIIINEAFNASVQGDEWIELLVVGDSVDIRGWSVRDFSATGISQPAATFSSSVLWGSLRKGTVIVLAGETAVATEDLDPSDFLVQVKYSNALLLNLNSGSGPNIGARSDALQILNAAKVHQCGISWGADNAGSLPAPKVHFTNEMTSGNPVFFNGGSVAELTGTSNWTFNTGNATRGTGNTAANSTWINGLRLSADGSGAASVLPDTLAHGTTTSLVVTYRPDTAFQATDLRIILPPDFTWSHSGADVSTLGFGSTTVVSGDTITFNGIIMTDDSARIMIQQVTAPERTGIYPIRVESKSQSEFRAIAPLPAIVVFGIPEAIADVRQGNSTGVPVRLGALVTVRGIVTVAGEFGGPAYVQDNTGGLAVYDSSFSNAVSPGDEVVVSGTMDFFNGLAELKSVLLHGVVSSNNTVTALPVTASQVANDGAGGLEHYEGLLVRLNGVVLRTLSGSTTPIWAVTGSGTNYRLLDATDTVDVRVDADVDFANAAAPQGTFDAVGVVSQYVTAAPFIGGYQLMPRSHADIIASGPVILTAPYESDITSGSMRIHWTTALGGTSRVRFGRTAMYELGVAGADDSLRTAHDVPLGGLAPATLYHVQVFSVAAADTSNSGDLIVSTASPAQSTGVMNAYFNKSADTSVAWDLPAQANQNLVTRLVRRIDDARRSVDAALYSLSGTPGAGTDVANALIAAKARGVQVRVIGEKDNRNTAPFNALASNGIPLITDDFDPVNAGAGYMHNKFFVIDGRGGAPESAWVWTGSWNVTEPGTNNDYQNAIEIQDQALARTYTVEFEEMWGSSSETPVAAVSRFGARKTDNTPHRFVVGGREVESYFSPSDRTTARIVQAVERAEHSVAFALLTFTRDELAAAVASQKAAGRKVRGVLDNRTDEDSKYNALRAQGVDVLIDPDAAGFLHHKYCVIDGENPSWRPVVVTGSHNWTSAAERSNNENTLIIHDASVANQYLQEFAARYTQAGGTDPVTVDVRERGAETPASWRLGQNYPNPFNPSTVIGYTVGNGGSGREGEGGRGGVLVQLTVYDILGREVAVLVRERQAPGIYTVRFDGAGLASGIYLYRLQAGGFTETKRMALLR